MRGSGRPHTCRAEVAARGVCELGLMQDLVQARRLRVAHCARARVGIHACLHLTDQPPCRPPTCIRDVKAGDHTSRWSAVLLPTHQQQRHAGQSCTLLYMIPCRQTRFIRSEHADQPMRAHGMHAEYALTGFGRELHALRETGLT